MPEMGNILKAVGIMFGGLFIWNLYSKWSGQSPEPMSFKDFSSAVLSLLSFLGSKGAKPSESTPAKPFRLPLSFKRGVYGGLVGGTIAGLIIGVGYYFAAATTDDPLPRSIILEIVPYAAIIGTVTGSMTLLFVYWFRHLVEGGFPSLIFNEVTAGAAAGFIFGPAVGALGGYWFGLRDDYAVSPNLLVWGAVTGPIFVVLGVLLYEFHGNPRNLKRALITSALITIIVGVLGIYVMNAYRVYDWLTKGKTEELAIKGGAVVGLAIGLILGIQIGLTLFLYRRLEVRQEAKEE
jgi:hypothetical protein